MNKPESTTQEIRELLSEWKGSRCNMSNLMRELYDASTMLLDRLEAKNGRITELEAQLKDRHKRIDKLMKVAGESLIAVEDTDYVKKLKAQLAESEAWVKSYRTDGKAMLLEQRQRIEELESQLEERKTWGELYLKYSERVVKLEAQLADLKPYLQHHVDCRGWNDTSDTECNCGLYRIIHREKAE